MGASIIVRMAMSMIILVSVLMLLVGVFIFCLVCVLPPTIWYFLVVSEIPASSDVIIVLGGGGNARIEYGVSLFRLGYANKILFTGYDAHSMARYALYLGVSNADILLEDRSNTTYDNAKNSLEIMRTQGFRSVMIVTSCYHTRRANIIFKHAFRELDTTIACPPYDSKLDRDWWKDKETATSVINEYLKLVYYYMFQRLT